MASGARSLLEPTPDKLVKDESMADKIPPNVHFIWVGNLIPSKQAQLIRSWALIP